jgi:hypothetical protein
MMRNQIARRNLKALQRIALVAKGENLIRERAMEHLKTHTENGYQPLVNLPNPVAIDTRKGDARGSINPASSSHILGRVTLALFPIWFLLLIGELPLTLAFTPVNLHLFRDIKNRDNFGRYNTF